MGRRILKGTKSIPITNARRFITTQVNAFGDALEFASASIVRLRVQHTDHDVDVAKAFEALSKVAVKVVIEREPKPKAPKVPEKRETMTAREAVLALISESSFYDKPKLTDLCERVMVECGM